MWPTYALHSLLFFATFGAGFAQPDAESPSTPRALSFKFEKVKRNDLNIPNRRRKRDTVLQRLDNEDFLYYANVSIGTPPQPLRLHLDTGSSDVWVESATSDLCMEPENPCKVTGTLSRKDSSTYKRLSGDFQISYVDGEFANGDYGTDVFHLSEGVSVKDLQFGIGLESTSTEGIMGIGMAENQVQVQRLGKAPYKSLVELMVEQKLIKSKAYSLYLNDLDAATGEILFGGIDTEKFHGKLTTLPMDRRPGSSKAREFIITMTGVSLTNDQGNNLKITADDFAIPVLLDTGSTYTYVPGEVANELAKQVGAKTNLASSVPVVPCDIRNYNGSIDFEFSGQTIKLGLNQLAVDAYTNSGAPATFGDGTPLCYFGIMDSGDDTYVLGDTFLRSAYVVYDIDNQQISIAQAAYGVEKSNIVEIGTGKSSVPDSQKPKDAIQVDPSKTMGSDETIMPSVTGAARNSGSSRVGSRYEILSLALVAVLTWLEV